MNDEEHLMEEQLSAFDVMQQQMDPLDQHYEAAETEEQNMAEEDRLKENQEPTGTKMLVSKEISEITVLIM